MKKTAAIFSLLVISLSMYSCKNRDLDGSDSLASEVPMTLAQSAEMVGKHCGSCHGSEGMTNAMDAMTLETMADVYEISPIFSTQLMKPVKCLHSMWSLLLREKNPKTFCIKRHTDFKRASELGLSK